VNLTKKGVQFKNVLLFLRKKQQVGFFLAIVTMSDILQIMVFLMYGFWSVSLVSSIDIAAGATLLVSFTIP
jgi:hypothetical protein